MMATSLTAATLEVAARRAIEATTGTTTPCHRRAHWTMLAHELGQTLEFFLAERTVFVLVESIEHPLGVRRSGRTVRSTGSRSVGTAARAARSTLIRPSIAGTIVWSRAAPAHGASAVTRWLTIRAATSFRTTITGSSTARPTAKIFPDRAANLAPLGAVERAVFVGVEIVKQLLFHRRVARRRLVGRLLRRLGECRPCQQACAQKGQ
jgi:hypothetical protein